MSHSLLNLHTLLIVCAVLYVITAGGHFSSTDEEDLYFNTSVLSDTLTQPFQMRQSESQTDIVIAPQEVGLSLVTLPWYWLGQGLSKWVQPRWQPYVQRAIMTTFNLAVTLATVTILYKWLYTLTSQKMALFTAGLYGLTTFAWPYSHTFYREPLVALCLLIAFWFGSQFRHTYHRPYLFITLSAVILAIATKTVAIIAIPWLIVITFRFEKVRLISTGRMIAIMGIILVIFSLILPAKMHTLNAYLQEIQFDFQHNLVDMIWYGFHGLLTSPGKGLFVTAPTILLAFIGLPKLWRDHRQEAIAIAGLFLTFLLFYSTRRGWHGGACWGPRYLLPVLPLAVMPIAWLNRFKPAVYKSVLRPLVVVLIMAGVGVQIAAVSIFHQNYYHLKLNQGVVQAQNLDGGRSYMAELYFDPSHSPILGHGQLLMTRTSHLLRFGTYDSVGVMPSSADTLWHYFITSEALDYWWLYLLTQADTSVPADDRLGFVLAPTADPWLQLTQNSGAKLNRWQVAWRDVEPSPNQFNFTALDKDIDRIQTAGLEPTLILTYPPNWALKNETRVPRGLDLPLDSPDNVWANFVRTTVAHYPDITYWEIWNEPDLEIYWGGSAEEYYQLLKVAYLVIKDTNPNAQVLMSGFAHWSNPAFAEDVLDFIAADPQAQANNHYFDISAWHWYVRSDLYERVQWSNNLLAERGIKKPIWINETNAFVGERHTLPPEEANLVVSADEQAAFIIQAIVNGWAAGAEKIFVFRLDDIPAMGKVGLITTEYMPRPAFTAYQAVAEFLHQAIPTGRWQQDGITYVSFETPTKQQIWVVWNETPHNQLLTITTDSQYIQVGYPNRAKQTHKIKAGFLQIELPPATVYSVYDHTDLMVGGMPVFLMFDPKIQ